MAESSLSFPSADGTLSALWNEADRAEAVAVIAHGAGNDMRHAYLERLARSLADLSVTTMRFNFPYTEAGRRAPDGGAILGETWRAALAEAARRAENLPLVACGKSLGGRIASMVAAEAGIDFPAEGLVFFGYPLHAPGKTNQTRDAHLEAVPVPMLFIQGSRDPFARQDLLSEVVAKLGSRARLSVIQGGDHSHRVPGRADEETTRELGAIAAEFIRELVGRK